jgi:glutamate synthase (NADH)
MVELGTVEDPKEIAELRSLIEDHRHYTGSEVATRVLQDFHRLLPSFVRVMPLDYKRVLEDNAVKEREQRQRHSVIDLIPSRTASQVNLAPEGLEDTLQPRDTLVHTINGIRDGTSPFLRSSSNSSISAATPTQEPNVPDFEDAVADDNAAREKAKKLDKLRGFMKYKRLGEHYRPARRRVKDWNELSTRLDDYELKHQAARCMDCGIPFCQSNNGCPVSNVIPQWNTLVFKDQWRDALNRLLLTNNFPEFTGRVCPAPCEGACVLGINESPVGIKSIECAIIDKVRLTLEKSSQIAHLYCRDSRWAGCCQILHIHVPERESQSLGRVRQVWHVPTSSTRLVIS